LEVIFEHVYDAGVSIERGSWEPGYAVRREWPDGVHEFIRFRESDSTLYRFIESDREFWRHGPLRPTSWSVVVISRRDFDLHGKRRDCRAPDCPGAVFRAVRRVRVGS
jgi:hypothetical protein